MIPKLDNSRISGGQIALCRGRTFSSHGSARKTGVAALAASSFRPPSAPASQNQDDTSPQEKHTKDVKNFAPIQRVFSMSPD